MKVRKIGNSNSEKNFRRKGKGVIPGISSSCFCAALIQQCEVDGSLSHPDIQCSSGQKGAAKGFS